jgi:ribonuclease HI
MKTVEIYTDGACSGNPGRGGWCAVLIYKGNQKTLSGAEDETTNNRMELLAVIKGLQALKEKCNVAVYSDSAYVVNAFAQGWVYNWAAKGWVLKEGGEVKNTDLWQTLLELTKAHKVEFVKVKGHSDNEFNNLCDKEAKRAIKLPINEH